MYQNTGKTLTCAKSSNFLIKIQIFKSQQNQGISKQIQKFQLAQIKNIYNELNENPDYQRNSNPSSNPNINFQTDKLVTLVTESPISLKFNNSYLQNL